jgi:hypothetical protein
VAEETRPRGSRDTVPRGWTPAPLPRFERAFVRALVIALVLHVPLVPLRLFEWMRVTLFGHLADYDAADAQAILPIDLDLLGKDPAVEPSAPPPPATTPSGDEPADAGAPRKPAPQPPPHPSEVADAGPPPLSDPVSAAGAAGKIAAKDPNIQILLSGAVLRKHRLGPWAARLLVMIPEWHAFFEGSPIDPIRDFDHLLITAPQFRQDTSKLVAVVDYNVAPDVAREAIDRVLHRTGGVWIDDAHVPAARARVGGAMRVLALLPERRLLVILPADAADQLDHLQRGRGFRSSAEGAVVSMLTPSRPFRGFFPLPETLKWLRLALTPTADGGADLALEAGDRSHDEAEAHAEQLTREIEARRKVDVLGLASVEIIEPVVFAAEGDVIRGRAHVSAQKLGMIMAFVEQKATERFGAPPGATQH